MTETEMSKSKRGLARDFLAFVIALSAVGCDGSSVPSEPVLRESLACEPLSPVDPGSVLPVPAPQRSRGEEAIAWDLRNNRLVALNHPGFASPMIVAVDLETRVVAAALEQGSSRGVAGLQVAAATSAILYTDGLFYADGFSLIRLGTGTIASPQNVEFLLSPDGRWVVFYDETWVIQDLSSGARRGLAAISGGPIAIDAAGDQVAFGFLNDPFADSIRVVTASTGAVRAMSRSGGALRSAGFIGDRLHVIISREQYIANGCYRATFLERQEGTEGEVTIGAVAARDLGPSGDLCVAWSWDTHTGVAVAEELPSAYKTPPRYQISLMGGGNMQAIGSADIWFPTDCTLSPDGRWFVYGNAMGYVDTGELYLKRVP